MQYYSIECNSLCKWSYCTNHLTFPKWGKGDRRLTAVDEDVKRYLNKHSQRQCRWLCLCSILFKIGD